MSFSTHFKVLLKKNFQTLKRKYGFAIFFLILPIISTGIFVLIKLLMKDPLLPEQHNFDRILPVS